MTLKSVNSFRHFGIVKTILLPICLFLKRCYPTNRSHSEGFKVSNSCDPMLHGLSATICSSKQIDNLSPLPQLSTVAFNTSSAGSIQFTIGRVSCSKDKKDTSEFHANVTVFYGRMHAPRASECANWTALRSFMYVMSHRTIELLFLAI